MQVSSLISPINMPSAPSAYNPYLASTDTTQPSTPSTPSTPSPNPYNDHVDGGLTRLLFGGIRGRSMAKLVFEKGNPGSQGLDAITKNAYFKNTAASAGIGAGLYASLSVLKQGWGMMRGEQDAQGAVANVITDSLRGGAAGVGAAAGGGLTALAMRAMGMTGTVGTVVTFIGGTIGATIGGNLVEATGVRDTLISTLGSQKANPQPEPQS